MATYAIGDVQGCYPELSRLLDKLRFDPAQDQLWFCGDLVNRGGQSLETLRLIHGLRENVVVTLGNHDLSLLAIAQRKPDAQSRVNPELREVLFAEDAPVLFEWLRNQKLLHYDEALGWGMVHAGLAPQWTLRQALRAAQEVERELSSPRHPRLLKNLLKKPSFLFGFTLLVATLLLALCGPLLFHVDTKTRVGLAFMEPSSKAWLGTDHLGLDMFSLLIQGLRSSLYVGLVAGTLGAASVADAPITLLCGDISFLHDVGSLWAARPERTQGASWSHPIALVVINNGGGRIFDQLPMAKHAGSDQRFWTTPHELELRHAAELYGLTYRRAQTRAELREALRAAHARPEVSLLEVVVAPNSAAERLQQLTGELEAEWARRLPAS